MVLDCITKVVDPAESVEAVKVVDKDSGDTVRAVVAGELWPYPYDMVDAELVVRADPVAAVAVAIVPVEAVPVLKSEPIAASDVVVKVDPGVDIVLLVEANSVVES